MKKKYSAYEISLIARLAVALDALEKIEKGAVNPKKLAADVLSTTDLMVL